VCSSDLELTEEDDAYIDIDLGPKLRLSFKLLIVSREDLKEKQFLNILENWDSSVIDHKEPTAFAFFGRSRVLPAMTGEHLNPQNLLDACEYLIGPCGCQIKRENPGYDVLSTVRWDAVITGQYTLAEALPRLTTVSASAVVPMNQAAIVPAASHASATASKADGSLMRNMLMTLGGAVILSCWSASCSKNAKTKCKPMIVTANRQAFTLMEMMVVISLITLLISMLMPALGKSRYAARLVKCEVNIHSQWQAQTVLADDNAGRFWKHDDYSADYYRSGNAPGSLWEAIHTGGYLTNGMATICPIHEATGGVWNNAAHLHYKIGRAHV